MGQMLKKIRSSTEATFAAEMIYKKTVDPSEIRKRIVDDKELHPETKAARLRALDRAVKWAKQIVGKPEARLPRGIRTRMTGTQELPTKKVSPVKVKDPLKRSRISKLLPFMK